MTTMLTKTVFNRLSPRFVLRYSFACDPDLHEVLGAVPPISHRGTAEEPTLAFPAFKSQGHAQIPLWLTAYKVIP